MLRNASGGGGGGLPSEYQQVEWIGTADNAYINTGVTTMDGVVTTIDFAIHSISGSNSKVILGYGNWYGQNIGQQYNTSRIGISNVALFSFSTNYFAERNEMVIHWNEISTSAEYRNETIQHTRSSSAEHGSLCIGKGFVASGVTTLPTSFYSVINSGVVNQRFVPCYRKADGVIGMYELVGGRFYTNAGSGSFTKGADV